MVLVSLLCVLGGTPLIGCTGARHEEGSTTLPTPADAVVEGWWQGRWQLDSEQLTRPEALQALAPADRALVQALAVGLAPAIFVQLDPPILRARFGGAAPQNVQRLDTTAPDRALLTLENGEQWLLRPAGPDQAQLHRPNQPPLPMRRQTDAPP